VHTLPAADASTFNCRSWTASNIGTPFQIGLFANASINDRLQIQLSSRILDLTLASPIRRRAGRERQIHFASSRNVYQGFTGTRYNLEEASDRSERAHRLENQPNSITPVRTPDCFWRRAPVCVRATPM
jgi:hypothetical protein